MVVSAGLSLFRPTGGGAAGDLPLLPPSSATIEFLETADGWQVRMSWPPTISWGDEASTSGSRLYTAAIFPNGFPNPDIGPRAAGEDSRLVEWGPIPSNTRFYVTISATNRDGETSADWRSRWYTTPVAVRRWLSNGMVWATAPARQWASKAA